MQQSVGGKIGNLIGKAQVNPVEQRLIVGYVLGFQCVITLAARRGDTLRNRTVRMLISLAFLIVRKHKHTLVQLIGSACRNENHHAVGTVHLNGSAIARGIITRLDGATVIQHLHLSLVIKVHVLHFARHGDQVALG